MSTTWPEGSPSTTQPTAGECDCPNTVTLRAFPKVDGMAHSLSRATPPSERKSSKKVG